MASADTKGTRDSQSNVVDKGTFGGYQICTFKWTASHLYTKLFEERNKGAIKSETFQIKGIEGDEVNLAVSLGSYNQSVETLHQAMITVSLVKESMSCNKDVTIWWSVIIERGTSLDCLKFDLQKNIVSLTSCTCLHKKTNFYLKNLKDQTSNSISLYIEVLWPEKKKVSKEKNEKYTLSVALEAMMRSGNFSDIKLLCKNGQFSCHKVLLAAMSPVFSAMFADKNNLEVKQGTVTIKDMDQDELNAFLKFVYMGNCKEELAQHAVALLAAANKYDVKGLMKMAEDELTKNMNVDNAIDMLLLGDKHNANDLRKKAMKVIMTNFAEVSKQAKWKELEKDNCAIVSLIEVSVENMKM